MTRVQGIGRGKVKRVESCEARLDQRLDCHQGAQGTIVAGWDNSVSGLKLEAMSFEKVLCRYASSRCCYGPSGRVQCHGRAVTARGETMGIGRELDSRLQKSTQLQISKLKIPLSKHHTQSSSSSSKLQVQNWPHFSSSSESSSNSNGLLEATDARSKVGFCPDTERREVRLVAARLILGRVIEGKPFNSVQA